ncbi:MAG: response regulator transcription factor [Tsuneonella sp.]
MEDQGVIAVVDDDAAVREALQGLFRSVGLHCRGYSSVMEFLDSPDRPDRGCLVLDVRLPGVSGLDFQDRMAQFGVRLPVVLMTGHGDIPMSVRAMKAGAIDFLPKPFRDQDMLDAVNQALRASAAELDVERQNDALRQRYARLTSREKQVMALVTAGKMNKQVAGELQLSEITVKIHRGAAMRKMEARSLAALVRMASELGQDLVPPA